MSRPENPFNDLWLTERLKPEEFVRVFSPVVVDQAEGLFSTGNIVVKGRQGSGKSMLLGLLSTPTRVAYARTGQPYPAPSNASTFLSVGTNLIRDNMQIVASRLVEIEASQREQWLASTFSDYLNYTLVEQLLKTITYLAQEQSKDGVLREELHVDLSHAAQARLIEGIRCSESWGGYFDTCRSMDEFGRRVTGRLVSYRRYFNGGDVDPDVLRSRTSVAEPIADLAECLRSAGVIPPRTAVFLRIDQHEELHALERKTQQSGVFRQVINRALAMRDSRVSYRIGTRHYAWSGELKIWGSGAPLENLRDYTIIDIDDILRRRENASHHAFKRFADDVLRRRLVAHEYEDVSQNNAIRQVFGTSLKPKERARIFAKGRPIPKTLIAGVSEGWGAYLAEMWARDPLAAQLGSAWLRQRAQAQMSTDARDLGADEAPWMAKDREWWRKERSEQAVMQMAGDARQSMIWSGDKQLVDLAGSNILAFMSICQKTWSAWLRQQEKIDDPKKVPSIDLHSQTIGVLDASKEWIDKIREGTDGEARQRLINALGRWFGRRMRADKAMSYPGHNGFSLKEEEFSRAGALTDLIRECRDHGDLMESPHTTKSTDGLARVKWYLNPVLCPHFRIPHNRTKEPIYTDVGELELLVSGEQLTPQVASAVQRGLFE